MHDSRPSSADQVIPPVPTTGTENFAMPPPPRTLQELAAGPIFSIETDNPTESAQPSFVIKSIATNRKRSDSKLLLLILLTLSLVTCALGAIVFLF